MSEELFVPIKRRGPKWWNTKPMRRFRRNPLGIIGMIILALFLLMALFAPQLTTTQLGKYKSNCTRDLGISKLEAKQILNPSKLVFWRSIINPPGSCYKIPRASYSEIPTPPNEYSPLGTSNGYDIFYGLVWGTRLALLVGIVVTGLGVFFGIIIGSIAGYFGGVIDTVIMKIIEIIFAIPPLIFSMIIISILGQSLRSILIALSIFSWTGYARFIRGEILGVRQNDFVDAARGLGAGNIRIMFKHILPNVISNVLIIASLQIGTVVLSVAGLSFLGLGPAVGTADWGQMVSFARSWVTGLPGQPFLYWYVLFWPGLTIVLFALSWNLLGDAIRDVLDVRSH
ncbi:MAG TPA: ABC transporter permease [Trueperaceae bacterium]|nr:ABC transporter permease [Trueperaceae bacterium]